MFILAEIEMEMQSEIDNHQSNQLWTTEQEKEALNILENKCSLKNRNYYYVKQNFQLKNFGGVKKVAKISNKKIMVTRQNVLSIISDVHIASGHRGEKRTHAILSLHFSNIPISLIKKYIMKCKKCSKKFKKI